MDLNRFHLLKDILFREPSFLLKYYLFHNTRVSKNVDYIFMADGKMVHGGLFDRIKGAVSVYALSRVQEKSFGIYFNKPFELSKYLQPASYNWIIDENDLIYCYPTSRPVIAYSENRNPKRLLKNRTGQIHFYFGGDILDHINQVYHTSFDWKVLFHELFQPTKYLGDYVMKIKTSLNKDYYVAHFRFQNLLGDNLESSAYKVLNDSGKLELVDACINAMERLLDVVNVHNMKIIVMSDSMIFLDIVRRRIPKVLVLDGFVKHIDTATSMDDDDNLKLFGDMYIIAGARKVFSIVGKGLYSSAFPEYSAKIGGCPFERLILQ